MTYNALIPVKALRTAKSRLAPYLSQEQRTQLVLDMLHHVLTVLQESLLFEHISVVSPDPIVLAETTRWGAQAVTEEVAGHNPALQAAAQWEQSSGVTALLTISADLPTLRVEELQRLVTCATFYDVLFASSRDGTGTNALLARPPLVLPYLFGIGSLQRYQDEAHLRQLRSKVIMSDGLAFDVDTIDDLDLLRQHEHPKLSTSALLQTTLHRPPAAQYAHPPHNT